MAYEAPGYRMPFHDETGKVRDERIARVMADENAEVLERSTDADGMSTKEAREWAQTKADVVGLQEFEKLGVEIEKKDLPKHVMHTFEGVLAKHGNNRYAEEAEFRKIVDGAYVMLFNFQEKSEGEWASNAVIFANGKLEQVTAPFLKVVAKSERDS